MTGAESGVSQEPLFGGRLWCLQHKKGYRFSMDAVLLAHFVAPKPWERILDLGAGCGIIALILAYRWPRNAVTALELQPRLAELVRRNAAVNGYAERITVIEGDCRKIETLVAAGSFDWVACNPPYQEKETGRRNPVSERALARHEIRVDLEGVIRAVSFVLKAGGRVALVYPAKRLAALFVVLKSHGLEPGRLRVVHGYPGGAGKLVLVEAGKGRGKGLAVLPPLYVRQAPDGEYSKEMARFYEP